MAAATGYSIARACDLSGAKLDLNEYDFPVHPAVLQAAAGVLAGEGAFSRYPMPHDDVTRRLVASLARRHGVSAENIVLTAGSDAALEYITQAFADMPVHVYVPTYQYFAQLVQGRTVTRSSPGVPPAPRSLVYIVNPNNPTGLAHTAPLTDPSCTYILDQAYAEFATDDHTLSVLPNALYTRTFSKAFGLAGLRIGYMVGPEALLARVRGIYNEKQVTLVAKAAALETLTQLPYYEGVIADVRQARHEFQEFLRAQKIACIHSHANFVALFVGANAGRLVAALDGEGVYIRLRDDMPGFVRVSIGCPASMRRAREAIKKYAWLF